MDKSKLESTENCYNLTHGADNSLGLRLVNDSHIRDYEKPWFDLISENKFFFQRVISLRSVGLFGELLVS